MDILFFIGIALILGFIGGKLSNKLGFPAVVGYLLAGVICGPSVLNIFSLELIGKLGVFNDLALGLVAFIIGCEMRMSILRKMGKGIIAIILSESFGAFILVTIGVYLLTHKLFIALIFGAMAPASAPAGTAVVLQEYKAKGILTNTIYAVVGLDDGLAIVIYAFAAAISKFLIVGGEISLSRVLFGPLVEIFGAIITGGLIGIVFGYFVRKIRHSGDILSFSLGAILVCVGISKFLQFSLILSCLSLGMVFANVYLLANRRAYNALQSITLPVYIIFFLIAGAHLQLYLLPAMGLLGIVYIITRSVGLVGGSFVGATSGGASGEYPVYSC